MSLTELFRKTTVKSNFNPCCDDPCVLKEAVRTEPQFRCTNCLEYHNTPTDVKTKPNGFTLIEVMIAMAILTLVLVTLTDYRGLDNSADGIYKRTVNNCIAEGELTLAECKEIAQYKADQLTY